MNHQFYPMTQSSGTEPASASELIAQELRDSGIAHPVEIEKPPAPAVTASGPGLTPQDGTPVAKEAPKIDMSALPAIEFKGPAQNVTLDRDTVSTAKTNAVETILMPAAAVAQAEELTKSIPNLRGVTSASDLEWGESFLHAQSSSPADDALNEALSRAGSDWRQGLMINGESIRSQVPRFPAVSNAQVEGEQALQMAFSHMQLGDIFLTGLWNSGFWVSFKPAPDSVWMTINRLLGTSVMDMNRETYGLLHSNATQLAINTVISLLIPFVYNTSVDPNEMNIDQIRENLSTLDEPDFIWGFISANYPKGFNIQRACIADASKCRHVITETVHVREMQLVDNAFLSEFHKNHMRSRGKGSMSLKSVKEYQARLAQQCDHLVTLTDDLGNTSELLLSTPSSLKKSQMTDRYIADVREAVLKVVTGEGEIPQRSTVYEEYMTAVEMRMYQHWVKEIRMNSNTVTSEADIGRILGLWTRDSSLRDQFFAAISAFIEKNSISVIGLQSAKCPSCGADHSRPDQKLRGMTDYIPVDTLQLFSNLAEFRARLIQARS